MHITYNFIVDLTSDTVVFLRHDNLHKHPVLCDASLFSSLVMWACLRLEKNICEVPPHVCDATRFQNRPEPQSSKQQPAPRIFWLILSRFWDICLWEFCLHISIQRWWIEFNLWSSEFWWRNGISIKLRATATSSINSFLYLLTLDNQQNNL